MHNQLFTLTSNYICKWGLFAHKQGTRASVYLARRVHIDLIYI